mmetsp:Transcript_38472/g.121187  ORF Transcript_38472/g.121187 Transcript_38472/m.121187 type:complete len:277 (-) Transcript_38472:1928-2758(-)
MRIRTNVANPKDKDAQDDELPNRVAEEGPEHVRRQQRLRARIRLAVQQVRARILSCKSERGKRIHNHVDPEQLNHVERTLCQDGSSGHSYRTSREVDCELELQEFADIVIHTSTPFHRLHDRCKVIIQDNDICSILRYLSSSNAHCKAHICFLQRRSIIGSISCHCNDLWRGGLTLLNASDQRQLVERRRPRQYSQVHPDLVEFIHVDLIVLVQYLLSKVRASHDRSRIIVIRQDSTLLCDRSCSSRVIACNHPDNDPSSFADSDSLRYLWPDRIL